MPPSSFYGFSTFPECGCFPLKSECFFQSTSTWQVLSLECECFTNGYKARVLFANISFSPFHYFFSPYANHPSRFPLSLTFWRCGVLGLVRLKLSKVA